MFKGLSSEQACNGKCSKIVDTFLCSAISVLGSQSTGFTKCLSEKQLVKPKSGSSLFVFAF